MKKQFRSLQLLCLIAGTLYLSGCKQDDDVTPITGINLLPNSTVLTDNKGQTLYFFASDANGQSSCGTTDGCLNDWPVFYVETPVVGTGIQSSDFGTITRADGIQQTTYKSWPLYYYSPTGDGKLENPGEKKGDGVDNLWFVARSNYTIMMVSEQLVGGDGKNYTSTYVEGTEVSTFFVDGKGRTLYTFSNDTKNNNNFTAPDFSNNGLWPVYETTIGGDLPIGINSTDFETIDVPAGHKQLTYKGRPLYYFGGNTTKPGDVERGQTKGISFVALGVWKVVNSNTPAAPASVTLIQNAGLGKIITDFKGRSLYFFTKDADGTNHFCTAPVGTACNGKWPVFYTDALSLGDASLLATDFSTITLNNGVKQSTYKGWPLYYFSTVGDGSIDATGTAGNGFANGLWYIAKPSYSLMAANAQLVGSDGNYYTSESIVGDAATPATPFFVDGKGRTLYRFNNDRNGTNTFSNNAPTHDAIWPIFYTPAAELDLPTGMNKADFADITVPAAGNQKQLTYKGWPLYSFGGTTSVPGDVRGQTRGLSFPATPAAGVSAPWHIVFTNNQVAPN
jgi:predicted lipoprotein with Yx(FWY)xxD motif